MSSEWTDLEAEASRKSNLRKRCGVAVLLEHVLNEYGTQAHTSVVKALGNQNISASTLAESLNKRVNAMYAISGQTLRVHRRCACSCDKGDTE